MTEPHAVPSRPPGTDVAELVAAAALAVPGVVALDGGPLGEIAAYLPGRRVAGVRRADGALEVHLVVDETADLRAVAAAVHRAVRMVSTEQLHVFVDDIAPVGPLAPRP